MRVLRVEAVAAFGAVTFLSIGVAVPIAVAGGQGTGCPAAWAYRSIESLAATGNAPVPGLIDASGQRRWVRVRTVVA